jgi:D-alanyl-D-alanine carboxypeptidase
MFVPHAVLLGACLLAALSATVGADDVDSYVQGAMRRHHIPGMSVAVVRDGKVLKAKGYGSASLQLDAPAAADTVYQLASMTKPFTAAGVMLLVEEGKIRLDGRVSEYLDGAPTSWDRITVRHLLTMTSGIRDYSTQIGESKEEFTGPKLYGVITGYPLDFAPGEQWSYSNSNYVLLALIVQKVTGKTWDRFLGDRVFAPLGMTATRRDGRADVIKRRASLYEWRDDALVNCRLLNSTLLDNGDGGLLSSVLDVAKFDAALVPGGLLTRESLEQTWTPVAFGGRALKHYGFGWYLNELGGQRVVLHGGGRPGTSAQITRFLDAKVTVIVLMNRSGVNAEEVAHEVARLYIEGLPPYEIRSMEHPPRWRDNGELIPVSSPRGRTSLKRHCGCSWIRQGKLHARRRS